MIRLSHISKTQPKNKGKGISFEIKRLFVRDPCVTDTRMAARRLTTKNVRQAGRSGRGREISVSMEESCKGKGKQRSGHNAVYTIKLQQQVTGCSVLINVCVP